MDTFTQARINHARERRIEAIARKEPLIRELLTDLTDAKVLLAKQAEENEDLSDQLERCSPEKKESAARMRDLEAQLKQAETTIEQLRSDLEAARALQGFAGDVIDLAKKFDDKQAGKDAARAPKAEPKQASKGKGKAD